MSISNLSGASYKIQRDAQFSPEFKRAFQVLEDPCGNIGNDSIYHLESLKDVLNAFKEDDTYQDSYMFSDQDVKLAEHLTKLKIDFFTI